MKFQRICQLMVPCSSASLLEAIKLSHLLQPVNKNFTLYTLAQVILIIQLDELMALESCHVPFSLFPKVWFSGYILFMGANTPSKLVHRSEQLSNINGFVASYITRV